jgi:putative PIN family toxin of toxin-antitoxin system
VIRAVLDTNVLVGAFLRPGGYSDRILRAALDGRFRLILSQTILEEAGRVLHYPRLQRRYPATESQIDRYLSALVSLAELTPGNLEVTAVPDDPKDDMVIAAAVEGLAEYIVSGDLHLKALVSYQGVKVVAPTKFLHMVESSQESR